MVLLALLVIWTDPVFGSMVNVYVRPSPLIFHRLTFELPHRLAMLATALADWLIWGLAPSATTYLGGVIIILAFGILTRDSLSVKKHY